MAIGYVLGLIAPVGSGPPVAFQSFFPSLDITVSCTNRSVFLKLRGSHVKKKFWDKVMSLGNTNALIVISQDMTLTYFFRTFLRYLYVLQFCFSVSYLTRFYFVFISFLFLSLFCPCGVVLSGVVCLYWGF
jgi:hypothetical protein